MTWPGRNRTYARAGFTLLELLVAATLTVLLAAFALGLAAALLRQWQEGSGRLRRQVELAKAYQLLHDDFEAAVVTPDSRPWLRLEQFPSGETAWRWLRTTESGAGLALVEWALVPRDERGRPVSGGWMLCRVEIPPGAWSGPYGEAGAVGPARPMAALADDEDWWPAGVLSALGAWEIRFARAGTEGGEDVLFAARSASSGEARTFLLSGPGAIGPGNPRAAIEWSFTFRPERVRTNSGDAGLAADASGVFLRGAGDFETWRLMLPDPR